MKTMAMLAVGLMLVAGCRSTPEPQYTITGIQIWGTNTITTVGDKLLLTGDDFTCTVRCPAVAPTNTWLMFK